MAKVKGSRTFSSQIIAPGMTALESDLTLEALSTASDPYTKLLLHGNGTDGSTTITDERGHIATVDPGAAELDTAQKVFGTASIELLNGGNNNISFPDSPDWDFGSGDFTIDFWVRFENAVAPQSPLVIAKFGGSGDRSWILYNNQNGIFLYLPGWNYYEDPCGAGIAWETDIWYHIAVVRDGNTLRFFKNGVQIGTNNVTGYTMIVSTATLRIASQADPTQRTWFDEVRISKGIARWTAGFSVPTEEYALTVQGNIYLKTNSLNNWAENSSGHLIPRADNAIDVGTDLFAVRSVHAHQVTNLDAPIDGSDAVNKDYVDAGAVPTYSYTSTTNSFETAATIAIPDNTTYSFEVKVSARYNNATTKSYWAFATGAALRNNAGSAILVEATPGAVITYGDYPAGTTGYDIQFTVSGNNLLIQVKGGSGESVNWEILVNL